MTDPDETITVADATCPACGCLCDDLVVTARGGRVVVAERACPIGSAWFLADPSPGGDAEAWVEGRACSGDEALDRAAEILLAARAPLVLGLAGATLEAQRLAVAIADRIGAAIDPSSSGGSLPRWRAVQRVGQVSATLGEVKDRADVVVFWGVDPVRTHPRHLERYSAEPASRFLPNGRADRTLIVADSGPTATSAVADAFVQADPSEWGDVLAGLRAALLGVALPEIEARFANLLGAQRSARYGAFFFDANLGAGPEGSAVVEEALKLVRDLNRQTRFVALTLAGPGNPTGAEAVLTWQAGSPTSVDLASGHPRYLPDDATAEGRLTRGEADAALILSDDPVKFLSADAASALTTLSTVAIGPDNRPATVQLRAARPGLQCGGTYLRSDGASLPLRPPLTTALPSEADWLSALAARIGAILP